MLLDWRIDLNLPKLAGFQFKRPTERSKCTLNAAEKLVLAEDFDELLPFLRLDHRLDIAVAIH